MKFKEAISLTAGACSGIISYFFGPCDIILQGMLILMVLDVAVGMLDALAGVSPKTKGGKLDSGAMTKGIAKKVGELLMVIVGNVMDMMTGLAVVRSGVVVTIAVSECISILENVSLLGVVDIPVLKRALEVLNRSVEHDNERD